MMNRVEPDLDAAAVSPFCTETSLALTRGMMVVMTAALVVPVASELPFHLDRCNRDMTAFGRT